MDIHELAAKATHPLSWRVGSTVGRTIYCGNGPDDLIGVMDTREDAAFVVACVNAFAALEAERDQLREQVRIAEEGLAGIKEDSAQYYNSQYLNMLASGTLNRMAAVGKGE